MIELRTNGNRIVNYATVDITLSLDTVASVFTFDGFFDREKEALINVFKPFQYQKADVWVVDDDLGINEKLITGQILNPGLSIERTPQLTSISGYSITGILEDVSIPTALHPLESNGLSLAQITKRFTDYFGLKLKIFDNALALANEPIEKAVANAGESIKNYISNLAKVKNITVAHDNLGRLLLYKVEALIPPAARIDESDQNVRISMSPNGQAMHSSITLIRQSSFNDENAGEFTAVSPFVPRGVNRPLVKLLEFGDINDVRTVAEAEVCREAKNFPVTIEMQGWTIDGRLIRAGFYLQINAPSIFIESTKMVVQSINFKASKQNGRTMTIVCVHPCVYTGVIPKKSPFK